MMFTKSKLLESIVFCSCWLLLLQSM